MIPHQTRSPALYYILWTAQDWSIVCLGIREPLDENLNVAMSVGFQISGLQPSGWRIFAYWTGGLGERHGHRQKGFERSRFEAQETGKISAQTEECKRREAQLQVGLKNVRDTAMILTETITEKRDWKVAATLKHVGNPSPITCRQSQGNRDKPKPVSWRTTPAVDIFGRSNGELNGQTWSIDEKCARKGQKNFHFCRKLLPAVLAAVDKRIQERPNRESPRRNQQASEN